MSANAIDRHYRDHCIYLLGVIVQRQHQYLHLLGKQSKRLVHLDVVATKDSDCFLKQVADWLNDSLCHELYVRSDNRYKYIHVRIVEVVVWQHYCLGHVDQFLHLSQSNLYVVFLIRRFVVLVRYSLSCLQAQRYQDHAL